MVAVPSAWLCIRGSRKGARRQMFVVLAALSLIEYATPDCSPSSVLLRAPEPRTFTHEGLTQKMLLNFLQLPCTLSGRPFDGAPLKIAWLSLVD